MRYGQQHASITQPAVQAARVERLGPEGEDRRVQELRRGNHAQRVLPFEVRSFVSKPGRRVDEEAPGTQQQQAGLAEQGRNA
jgi:hypothetical protein